jgi:uncharacterized membrane protein
MLTCEPSDQVVLGTGIYRGTGGSAHSPDVSPRNRWVPIITFLPVIVDRCFGVGMPPGHGHNHEQQPEWQGRATSA